MRSTCAITSPPEFFAAIAEARLSSRQRLPFHGDVAGGIGGGAAHERDLDREGLVEEPGLAAQLDELDEVLGGAGVELAAAEARVDEGAKPDLRQRPGQPRRNVAVEMRDAAERQVVGLDLVVEGERAELRHQRPMPADDASHEPLVGEPVEAALLAVAGRGGKHQRQSGGRRRLAETLRQGDDQLVRGADADEARDRDRVAVADERDRLCAVTILLAAMRLHAYGRSASHCAIPEPRRPCDLPPTKTPTWPPGSASSV